MARFCQPPFGPGSGMHPKRAMGRVAVECHATGDEGLFDFGGFFELGATLQHIVGRLRARNPGGFGVIQKDVKTLGAVLGSFDAGMKTSLSHKIQKLMSA